MKFSLVSVVTALAAASVAQAIPAPVPEAIVGRPRYYFPRVMKRQVDLGAGQNVTLGSPTQKDPSPPLTADSESGNGPTKSPSDTSPTNTRDAPTGSNVSGSQITDAPTGSPTDTDSTSGSKSTGLVGGLINTLTDSVFSPTATGGNPETDTNTASPTADPSITDRPTNTASDTAETGPANTSPTSVLLGLSSIIDSLTPTPTPTPTDDPTPTPTGTPSPTVDHNTENNSPTATPSKSGILSSLVDNVTSDLPTNPGTGIPSITSDPPKNTDGPTSPVTSKEPESPVTSPPSVTNGPTNPITSQPPVTETPTGGPSTSAGITGPATGSSSNPAPEPSPTSPVSPTNTAATSPVSPTNTAVASPTVTSQPSEPVVTNQPSQSSAPSAPPTTANQSVQVSSAASIQPTGTNTNTALLAETSILSATESPTGSAQSTASIIPSSLPKIIQPQGGVPDAPADYTLIQLGFTYGLNYGFVVGSSTAVAQIFSYLPAGVSHGVDLTNDKVVMQYLQPYNTLPTLGYITTLAMAYVPKNEVNALSLALLNPNSALYNNPNPSVKTLMGMIDPSIPLLAGSTVAGGSPITSSNGAATTNTDPNAGGAAGDANSSGSGVKPSSIGIGVGVVAGAAVYGAAMFFVARRYKKKKAGHRRTSSVLTGSTGSSGSRTNEGTDLMGSNRDSYGTRLTGTQSYQQPGHGSRNSDHSRETGRHHISPPVMAENSLGWN